MQFTRLALPILLVLGGSIAFAKPPEFKPRVVIPRAMPAIKDPQIISAEQAKLADDELVLGVVIKGKPRAYPINMLTGPRREIINDQLGGLPIAATWWHLCHNGIVYASRVKGQRLNFAVSGMLWQRSLVMRDEETGTLWSHLLGRGMRGEHEGVELESIPSLITDWKTWRSKHPATTVLSMRRSAQVFNRDFYQRGGGLKQFVLGMASGSDARAWPLDQLKSVQAVNDQFRDQPLLLVFDNDSVTAFAYQRRVGERTLTFQQKDGQLVDRDTESTWDPRSGRATAGPLKGQSLKPALGILSFRRAWEVFHPESDYWSP